MRTEGLLQRWIRFNGVGALGLALQLAVLGCLVHTAGMHYLPATAIAVEAAVLHNFVWHQRWTWRDRRSASGVAILRRVGRFHLLNGAVSLIGNLMLMRVLTGSVHLDPMASNFVAVLICSIVNFAAGELLVFRRAAMVMLLVLAVHPASAAAERSSPDSSAGEMLAVELRPQTLHAWTKYEQKVDGRYDAAPPTGSAFFALDAFQVSSWRATALGGGIAMRRIDRSGPGDPAIEVPDGRIHHWAGAMFVPNTSIDAVLDRLSRLAGNEAAHYEEVVASKLLARDGDRYRIFLKLRRSKLGVTATYNTEHLVQYRRLGSTRATARSVSTRIAELEDAGTPQEREKKIGSDSGYLWRLNAYWRYEAVNGGVLVECESVSLSRDVPMLLKLFVTRLVEGLARESLERTLTGLRAALTKSIQRDTVSGRKPFLMSGTSTIRTPTGGTSTADTSARSISACVTSPSRSAPSRVAGIRRATA